jgi:hypothetical protein
VEEAITEEPDAGRNGTCPARGEGLGHKIVMARRGAWTKTRRWMRAGHSGRRERDQLVVRSVRILRAFGPFRRRIMACGRPRRMRGGSLEVLREKRRWMGERGCWSRGAWVETRHAEKLTHEWRYHGGKTDRGDGAVQMVSEGRSRAREPKGGTGENETTYLGLSTGAGGACSSCQGLVLSIDQAATGTEGVVDERAGCYVTRCLPI